MAAPSRHIPIFFTSPAESGRVFQFSTIERNGVYAGWNIDCDREPLEPGEIKQNAKVEAWIEECIYQVRLAVGEEEYARVERQQK